MSLKNALCLIAYAICVLGMINCGDGKYTDAKRVTIKYLETMEKYATAVEISDTPDALVQAVDRFVDEMAALRPEMEAIEKKYPELTDMATPPSELEDLAQRMDMLSQRMVAAQTKLMQYSSNPDVQQALQKLQNIK
jgi:prefoldin subunit 5